MNRNIALSAVSIAIALAAGAAQAEDKVKIGFITDMSSLYADVEGKGGATAIQMAIDDFGGKVNGMTIELVTADHQNKADIAAIKAREWFDTRQPRRCCSAAPTRAPPGDGEGRGRRRSASSWSIGAGARTLTNEQCTPYTVHYAYDTVALAKGTGGAVVEAGRQVLVFPDRRLRLRPVAGNGHRRVVKANGGTVRRQRQASAHASDFSSFLLQAQASKAQILGLANAGGDTINAIKAAKEFGITKTMKMAGLLVFINDIHSLGLKNTQGLHLTDSWYWDLNDADPRLVASASSTRSSACRRCLRPPTTRPP